MGNVVVAIPLERSFKPMSALPARLSSPSRRFLPFVFYGTDPPKADIASRVWKQAPGNSMAV